MRASPSISIPDVCSSDIDQIKNIEGLLYLLVTLCTYAQSVLRNNETTRQNTKVHGKYSVNRVFSGLADTTIPNTSSFPIYLL